jgi:hypothetical protein
MISTLLKTDKGYGEACRLAGCMGWPVFDRTVEVYIELPHKDWQSEIEGSKDPRHPDPPAIALAIAALEGGITRYLEHESREGRD